MGKKEYEGLPLYTLTAAQNVYLFQLKYSLHKAVLHVPSCMIVDHPLDWSLLERALNIEIERNDCMRLHFVKTKEGLKQYYIPKYTISNVPVDDYRGMEEKEAKNLLHKRGSHPTLDYLHGEVFRVRFFRSHDGRYGVYLCVSHMNMDLAATFLFYNDLFSVYDALENGRELPKPLGSSEEMLKRDLEREANDQKRDKDIKFFKDLYKPDYDIGFTAIDGTRLLEQYRKKKKDPTLMAPPIPIILFDKSTTEECTMKPELAQKIYAFLEENKMSMAALFYVGYRTYMSAVNNRTPSVCFINTINRRSTLLENSCGGSRASAIMLNTTIGEDYSFREALKEASSVMMLLYGHMNIPLTESMQILLKQKKFSAMGQFSSVNFSCMPYLPVIEELKDWNMNFSGFSNGYNAMFDYTVIFPNSYTGGIDFFYEHNVHYVPKDAVHRMHECMIKVLEMGIDNPDVTIGELMDSL